MEDYWKAVQSVVAFPHRRDDDVFDRINSRYTVALLMSFAALVTFQQFTGQPITCWVPAHFTDAHEAYTNSFCWVNDTYYVSFDTQLPVRDHVSKRKIRYYQWVPFLLLVQALGFYFPSLFWSSWNTVSGVDCDSILDTAYTLTQTDTESTRGDTLDLVLKQLERFLGKGKAQSRCWCCKQPCGRRSGSYLSVLYLFTKLLYLANIIGQVFWISSYLHKDYPSYGFEVMKGLASDDKWHLQPLDIFPRVTLCDMVIRSVGNLRTYTLQCTLNLNLFNEKIYMLLWFWYVIVGLLTTIGLCQFVLRAVLVCDRRGFVTNQLMERDWNVRKDPERVEAFVKGYLRRDGALILRLISHNTNSVTSREIAYGLWCRWLKRNNNENGLTTVMVDKDSDAQTVSSSPSSGCKSSYSAADSGVVCN